MFRHINKAEKYFQDAIYIYMGDFMAHKMVPDTSEHLLVVKTWMKTNEVGETVCFFEVFNDLSRTIRKAYD